MKNSIVKQWSSDTETARQQNIERQRKAAKRQRAEASARRKVAKRWAMVGRTESYRNAAVKAVCRRTTQLLEEELYDGILLNLRCGDDRQSANVQRRLLRRIVEKRQAQAAHRLTGRSADRWATRQWQRSTSWSMAALHRHQTCA